MMGNCSLFAFSAPAQSRLKRSPEPGWSSGGYTTTYYKPYNSGYTSSCYNCGGGGYYSGGHHGGYNSGYNSYNSGHYHSHGGRRRGGGGGRKLRRLLKTKAVLGTGILIGSALSRGGGIGFGK